MSFAEQILYEDNHLLIINKRPGQLAQGDKSGDAPISELAKDFIKHRDQKPGNVYMGIPHRLDRPVGGILVLAKTSKAMTRMSELFRSKNIKKTYMAVVNERPAKANDLLVGYMQKNERMNKSFVIDHEKNGYKKAELSYQLRASSDRYHLLEVSLGTGRHHQIRAQLANMGCIIKGDLKYGAPRSNKDGSIDLLAWKISFEHPVKKIPIEVKAPMPESAPWAYFATQLEA